ncbi:MAG: nucleotide exchange factor GrpE [Lachnospiraceae bacterium]|nr:nucleotide exchange factor GrpE [Lachnospiraceae bacterium]
MAKNKKREEIKEETKEPEEESGIEIEDVDEEGKEAEEEEKAAEAKEAEETGEEKEPEEPEEKQPAPEKKSPFKKKEKKDKLSEKIDELNDRVKRQMAEFENFRKRTEKEKSQSFELGAKSVIEKILPVIDNFERGLAAVSEEQKGDPFVEGMDKIYKQLLTELENLGVKPIEAVGEEFDPEFHNAVMQEASEEYESGIVTKELQKGYIFRDSVVRHSMVAVAE